MASRPIRKAETTMDNYCAFSKEHKCIMWSDYQITRFELEECHVLCHGNWIEIQRLRDRIDQLELILGQAGVAYPKY